MRIITLALLALVILIQYPLWLGKGGWLRVHELEQQVATQQKSNGQAKARNDKLEAEVRDLREGAGAIEERARYELGMIREGEIFVQTVDPSHASQAAVSAPAPGGAQSGASANTPANTPANTAASGPGATANPTSGPAAAGAAH